MRRARTLSLIAAAGLAGAAVAPTAFAQGHRNHRPPGHVEHSKAGAPGIGFATPTVVDEYRPGFEPDNAIVPLIKGDRYAGSTFVSMPNGFSTTMSYVWRSDDARATFHPVEGNVFGKTTTCVGGGDTEMQVDPVSGTLYLADLQGLTNFSTSSSTDGGHTWATTCVAVPGTGVDRQWAAIDTNGGTAALGAGPNDGRMYFDYDNVNADATGSGNQLVMNESMNGVNFGADCQGTNLGASSPLPSAASACVVPPAMVSPNETIPGNVLVDNVRGSSYQHRVYAIHTGNNGSSVVVSYCSGAPGDHTAATVAADCTDPTAFTPGQNANDPLDRTNRYWHDTYVQSPGSYETGQLFPSVAIDTAGHLYAVWSQYPLSSAGKVDGPGEILLSESRDGAKTWSRPVAVSRPNINEAVMPWVTAGSPGRVGVAYYWANDTRDGNVGPDASNRAVWNLDYAFSENALAATPTFSWNQVNEPGHPIKFGNISTGGFGGSEDRSLGDFFQVHTGPQGQAVISYVDDTSANRNADVCGGCGQTPAEASGPVMVATQDAGPALYADQHVPSRPAATGSVAVGPSQAAKDAFLAAGGQDVPAAANQRLLGATAKRVGSDLVVTLTTADPQLASDLSVSPSLGGPVADWMVRWAAPAYGPQRSGYATCSGADGDTSCDGNIFYVGMESVSGSAPSFFTGSTQALSSTHTKYFEYPATTAVRGRISGSSITWTVPLSDIGAPGAGQGLFSVTGFTSTQLTPSPTQTLALPTNGEAGAANIPNMISALPPFDYLLRP